LLEHANSVASQAGGVKRADGLANKLLEAYVFTIKTKSIPLLAFVALAVSVQAKRPFVLADCPVYRGAVEVVDARTFARLYHRDAVQVERTECRGHQVHVFICYRGGRQSHEFRLLSKQPTWWYQKFPPAYEPIKYSRRPWPVWCPVLYLSHNANGERGTERLRAELVFDLRPLRRWPGPIPMRLNAPEVRKNTKAIELIFK